MNIHDQNNPYPPIKVERPNIEYAKILIHDYAGTVSEDTAVHLYMYQNFLQYDEWAEFAEIIEKIAIVEMKHLELLGRTILKLGLNPIYATFSSENNNIIYWGSENVDYTDRLKQMLRADIVAETEAIKQYKLHWKIIEDKYIRALIERILEDEEEHLRIFEKLYSIVKKENRD